MLASPGRLISPGNRLTLDQRAMVAIRRAGGTVLAAGAATPVLGVELASQDNATLRNNAAPTFDTLTGSMFSNGTDKVSVGYDNQVISVVAGKTYLINVAGSVASGSIVYSLRAGGALGTARASSGNYTTGLASWVTMYVATATEDLTLRVSSNTGSGATAVTLGSRSAKEVTGYTYGNPPVRNFFDSAGTDILDNVTQVDQPVGLVVDAAGAVGPELFSYVSGDAGVSHNGGVITFASVAVSAGATGAVTLATGKSYQVTFTVTGFTAGGVSVKAGSTGTAGVGAHANGTFTEVFSPTGSSGPLQFVARYATSTLTVSNISVKEITGNHATQPTTGSKPTLRRGLVNQLLWSGDFTNAAWVKTGATVATGQAGPSGGSSGFKLVESAASTQHYFIQNAISGSGMASAAYIVKAGGRTKVRIRSEGPQTFGLATNFNLSTVSIQSGSGSIADMGNGFYLCVANSTGNGSGASGYHLIQPTDDSWNETYLGDGASGILIYRAAIFAGTVTAQQILAAGGIPLTTTAPASSALGDYWWQFDPAAPGDFFNIGTGAIGANVDIFIGATRTKDKCVLLDGMDGGGNKYVGVIDATNTSVLATNGIGTAFTTFVNGVAVGSVGYLTRGQLTAAWPIGSTAVLEFRNVGLSTWTALRLFGYPTFEFGGSCASVVIAQAGSDRALIRAWVAKQQGQTL